jgi:hypothetical protein
MDNSPSELPSRAEFGLISSIKSDSPESWSGKTFLTIDTDWASDEILEDTLSLASSVGIPSTWFFTNNSAIRHESYLATLCELGIHPNFNALLSPQNYSSNATSSHQVIRDLADEFPLATSVRSHSLTQSERIVDTFIECGFTHVSNTFVPTGQSIELRPWRLWSDTTMVPHNWQDNVSLRMKLPLPGSAKTNSMNVLNFHPIHVFLNTSDMAVYESTRHIHTKPRELKRHVFRGEGIRRDFERTLERFA